MNLPGFISVKTTSLFKEPFVFGNLFLRRSMSLFLIITSELVLSRTFKVISSSATEFFPKDKKSSFKLLQLMFFKLLVLFFWYFFLRIKTYFI